MKYKLTILSLLSVSFSPFMVKSASIGIESAREDQKALNDRLFQAIKGGNSSEVDKLLDSHADINVKDENGNTALMLAAEAGHTNIVKSILDKNADINATNYQESLSFAIFGPCRCHNEGPTALMKAAENGHDETVEVLLDAGANINYVDPEMSTALMNAAAGGHIKTVEILLKRGADVNAANKLDGDTALIEAATITDTKTETDSIAIVNILLKANAEIPKDISKFPEAIQAILEQERQTRKSSIESPAKASREDGAGKA